MRLEIVVAVERLEIKRVMRPDPEIDRGVEGGGLGRAQIVFRGGVLEVEKRLGRQVVGRAVGAVEHDPVGVVVGVVAVRGVARGGDAETEIFVGAEDAEDVGVGGAEILAPLVGQIEVGAAGAEADLAPIALEGGAGDDVDDAADGVAVAVGRRGLDDLDVGDAIGGEVAAVETAAAHAVAVDLERVELAGEPADVGTLGRAILALVDGDAGEALERVADVAVVHRAEDFLGDDIHDAAGGLLLVDGEGLPTGRLGDLERGHPQHVVLEAGVERGGGTGAHGDFAPEQIEADIFRLDLVGAGGHSGDGVAALSVRGVGGGRAVDFDHGALQGLARGGIEDTARDRAGGRSLRQHRGGEQRERKAEDNRPAT